MNFKPTHPRRDDFENVSPLEKLESRIIKWPFLLGDFVLVLTAISIAFANGGPLTIAKFACCVMGVGLGSAIAIIPFLIDYLTNSRLRMMRKMMEQREQWRISLEQELIDNQDDNRRQIRLLKEAVSNLQMQIGVTPTNYAEDSVQLGAAQSSTSNQTNAIEAQLSLGDDHEQTLSPTAHIAKTSFAIGKNKLLSKAITQAQKNKPTRTVDRLIKGLDPQQKQTV
jgi:hypothetical protein